MKKGRSLLFGVALALAATGCPREKNQTLTRAQAREATEQAALASQAESLTINSVELSTNFTIGGAVEQAAAELRTFIETQLPCAEIIQDGASLSIEYGALPGSCTYRGHTFSGTQRITVTRNDMGNVLVEHEWDELSNGKVKVSGSAEVTWDFSAQTRHVVHSATWTDLRSGRQGTGSGDRTQSALPGGITEGFSVSGTRTWEGESGTWDLIIDGVEMRWTDPVPQAGSYTLNTPYNQALELSFSRVDDKTIEVTVSNERRSFSFKVTALGVQATS